MNVHNINKFINYMDTCDDFDFKHKHYDVTACASDCFNIKSHSKIHCNIVLARLLGIDHKAVARIVNGIGHLDPQIMIAKDVSFALRSYIKTRSVEWPT